MIRLLFALLLLTACAKPPPLSTPLATPTAVTPLKGILGPAWGPVDAAIIKVDDSGKGEKDGDSTRLGGGIANFDIGGIGRNSEEKLGKGEEDDGSRLALARINSSNGSPHLNRPSQVEGYLRSQPALAWPKPRVARVSASESQIRTLENDPTDIPWRGMVVLPNLSVVYLNPEMAATMWSVIGCESRFNPRAIGAAGERGLLQIHPIHQKRIAALGFTWDQMLEAEPNVVVAASIWAEQGWQPWSCQSTYRADGTSGEW